MTLVPPMQQCQAPALHSLVSSANLSASMNSQLKERLKFFWNFKQGDNKKAPNRELFLLYTIFAQFLLPFPGTFQHLVRWRFCLPA